MGASYTKLHWKILAEDWIKVLARAEKFPRELRRKNVHGNLPLHFACYSGIASLEVIRALVDNYPASVNILNSNGYDPLTLAKLNYNLENMIRRNEVIAFLASRMENNNDDLTLTTTNQRKIIIDSSLDYDPSFKTDQCVVCLHDAVSYSCFPCGHACLCESCAVSIVNNQMNNNSCPICRSELEKIIKLKKEPSIQSSLASENIDISPALFEIAGQA